MTKEVMQQAMEALKKCHYYMIDAGLPNQSLLNEAFTAYKALEEALTERPAQHRPVAWMHEWEDGERIPKLHELDDRCRDQPKTVHPLVYMRTWVGLTDKEVINVIPDDDTPISLGEAFSKFAELIEAKLKEKNA